MTISEYIKNINKRYKTGISREFGFQGSELGKAQINDEQYFGNVPLKAWNFYIGGLPARPKMAQRPP